MKFKKQLKFLLVIILLLSISIPSFAGSIKFTKNGYPAALTKGLLDRAILLRMNGDFNALQALINANLVFVLKEDVKVELLDVTFSGKIKIRPWGHNIDLWTVSDAVK